MSKSIGLNEIGAGFAPFPRHYVYGILRLYILEAVEQGWADHPDYELEATLVPVKGTVAPRTYTVKYSQRHMYAPELKKQGK